MTNKIRTRQYFTWQTPAPTCKQTSNNLFIQKKDLDIFETILLISIPGHAAGMFKLLPIE